MTHDQRCAECGVELTPYESENCGDLCSDCESELEEELYEQDDELAEGMDSATTDDVGRDSDSNRGDPDFRLSDNPEDIEDQAT